MSFFQISLTRHFAISITLVTLCLGMARLQLWRAETRGAAFALRQSMVRMAPLTLNATHRNAEALQWHPVVVRGTWLRESTIFLDNKVYRQRVGYQVLTALRIEDSSAVVLVNRGWVAAPRLRTELPIVTTPVGLLEITGIARKFEDHAFEFGHYQPIGTVWQHVREAEYRQLSRQDALPVIVLQSDAVPTGAITDGLIRDWSDIIAHENPASRHYGYATMWVVFAILAAGYGFVAGKRG